MSSTRHAAPNSPFAHERYMSDPRYVERRALNGRAVAEKAASLDDAMLARLILFLQGISVEHGGLYLVEEWILKGALNWLGTPTMRRLGFKGSHGPTDVKAIRAELGLSSDAFPLAGEVCRYARRPDERLAVEYPGSYAQEVSAWEADQTKAKRQPTSYPAQAFVDRCTKTARKELGGFLRELCLNPAVTFAEDGKDHETFEELQGIVPRAWASFPWMDLASALASFEIHHCEAVKNGTVETSITHKVWRSIDRAREVHLSSSPVPRHIVIVQGIEGIGKTSAAKTKCGLHLGEMRFIPLLGNVNLKDFFRSTSRGCGLPHGENLKAEQMKTNVENFLRVSRLILVIDEAHRLFPDGNRVYAAPALMNWIYMLSELKAPVVMLVTPQFATRMDIVENCTDWRSGQLKRRVRSYETLPEKLTVEDLESIAKNRFPKASASIIDEVVGYAGSTRYPMDAIHNIAEDAHRLAADAKRERPIFADVQSAIDECARPTYTALTTQRDLDILSGSKSRGGRKGKPSATQLQGGSSSVAGTQPKAPQGRGVAPSISDALQNEEPARNRLREFDLART